MPTRMLDRLMFFVLATKSRGIENGFFSSERPVHEINSSGADRCLGFI